MSWRRDADSGGVCDSVGQNITGFEDPLTCEYGCSGDIRELSYVCTDLNIDEDWQYGGDTFTHLFPTNIDIVTIGFTGRYWIDPFTDEWNVSTTFSLTTRSDTGQINSSPRAVLAPVIRLLEGCNHVIPIAVSDPDNDIIQCRWATGVECEGVCNRFPGAQLNSSTCTITYTADMGEGYNAAALMIEDFVPGSTRPMSNVAFQFLVLVVASTESCSQQPQFIDPTLPQGSCVSISAGETFTTQLTATSNSSLVTVIEIKTTYPNGTNIGTLQHLEGTNNYYVDITWLPTTSQLNQVHILCYTAINSVSVASEQTCIELAVGFLPPMPNRSSEMPDHLIVDPSNTVFNISFNVNVQRPLDSAFIIFYEFASEMEVHRIDASSSAEVTFSNTTEITLQPNFAFMENTIYYILFDEGIVQSTEGCGLKNEEVTNKTFWTFEVIDTTPPVITFIDNPAESNTSGNISITWSSDENVTWECYLIIASIMLPVNCSDASWTGYNLERGNYTLNVTACDAAGNKAFLLHTFFFTSKQNKNNMRIINSIMITYSTIILYIYFMCTLRRGLLLCFMFM